MSKIAIVVCPNIRNFGSVLQSYATQKAVETLGYDCEYINYTKTKLSAYKYFIQLFIPSIMAERKSFQNRKKFQKKHLEVFWRRGQIFDAFVDEYMKSSVHLLGYKQLKKAGEEYEIAVLGSDQVWNPINSGSDFYTLNWLPNSTKRIAYASSFGVSRIPILLKGFYKRFLKKFDFISVRETRGVELVKELIDRDVQVTCDPTMLFDASEWDEVAGETPIVEGDYIFCYFLGNRDEPRKCVIKFSEAVGLKLVMMPFFGEISEMDYTMPAEYVDNPGPREFINAIKYARYVCTDSFHGTVFSVIFQKEFMVFRRHTSDSNKDTFSRLESLLKMLGVENRSVPDDVFLDVAFENKINYTKVIPKLENIRKKSWEYLKNALEY